MAWGGMAGPYTRNSPMPAQKTQRPRFVLLIAAVGMIAMSLGACLFSAGAFLELLKLSRVANWPTVEGTITTSSTRPGCKTATDFSPLLEYRYIFDGVTHLGNRHDLGMAICDTEANAGKWALQYPVGSHVTVHVDPSRPAEAVLETAVDTGALWFMGTAALLIGSTGLYWVLPRLRVILRGRGSRSG